MRVINKKSIFTDTCAYHKYGPEGKEGKGEKTPDLETQKEKNKSYTGQKVDLLYSTRK